MNRKLRILYIADGASIHTKRWVGWFAQRHDVHLLSAPPLNGKVWDRPDITLSPGSTDMIIPKINTFRVWSHLKKEIHRFRPDIIHAHYVTVNGWLAAASGFHPYVTTAWGSDIFRSSGWGQQMNKWALRGADLNTADSQEMIQRLIELGSLPAKTREIQFGVDTQYFAPGEAGEQLRAELGIPTNHQVIVSPRALSGLYNVPVITEAFASVTKEEPNTSLIIMSYNAVPTEETRVREIVEKFGLQSRVHFVPGLPHARMPALYQLASIVVSIPSSDTTPVTLLEAMSTGTHIIASNLPSLQEWITNEKNGWLVDPKNTSAVARAMHEALHTPPDVTKQMLDNNRALVEQRASQRVHMEQMEKEYYRLTDRPE